MAVLVQVPAYFGFVAIRVSTPIARKRHGLPFALTCAMAGARDFRELAAWRRANELQMLCEELLQSARVKRDFKYFDQLSDASGSAPRNIPKTEPVKSKRRDPEP
jgi:hypothetical protein